MKILLTGASGFVGKALYKELLTLGHEVVAGVRSAEKAIGFSEYTIVGDIDQYTNWSEALLNVDVVVHLAARVHVLKESSQDSLALFRKVNLNGTLNLAIQASQSNVKRFIFISSVKAVADSSVIGFPIHADQKMLPVDPYGISKAEAESALIKIAHKNKMEYVIVRPPLIYGLGVKANFLKVIKMLKLQIPLPFKCLTLNLRSFVSLNNFISFLVVCINHPLAANQAFMVSDGEDLSTASLLNRLCFAMGKRVRLFCIRPIYLEFLLRVLGKSDMAKSLLGTLQVNIDKNYQMLSWKPSRPLDEEFRDLMQSF